jgi:hypothetical protein
MKTQPEISSFQVWEVAPIQLDIGYRVAGSRESRQVEVTGVGTIDVQDRIARGIP